MRYLASSGYTKNVVNLRWLSLVMGSSAILCFSAYSSSSPFATPRLFCSSSHPSYLRVKPWPQDANHAKDVLNYWLGSMDGHVNMTKSSLWFGNTEETDDEIRAKFSFISLFVLQTS